MQDDHEDRRKVFCGLRLSVVKKLQMVLIFLASSGILLFQVGP